MAQLKSLQRRLTSTVVLGAEVRERELREARLEEEKVKLAEEKRSGIKSWWRRMVCRQTLLVEVAFAGREVVESSQAEERFRWRRKVVPGGARGAGGGGQRLEKVMEEVKRSARDSFEEEVAEVFTVQEAEEVFPDDFEDHLLLDNNDTKRDESDVNNSAFNITTFCSSSFTSIDSSYQHFKKNLRQSLRPSSSMKMKEAEEGEETYESFDAVDGNVEQLLTKNYGRSRLRGQ